MEPQRVAIFEENLEICADHKQGSRPFCFLCDEWLDPLVNSGCVDVVDSLLQDWATSADASDCNSRDEAGGQILTSLKCKLCLVVYR